MKARQKKARLGKVHSSCGSERRPYRATADSHRIIFTRLWERAPETVSVSLPDVLDFALNRHVEFGERHFSVSVVRSGVVLREQDRVGEHVISFRDLVELMQGQRLIPT